MAAPFPCLGGSALPARAAQSPERLGRKGCFHAQKTRGVSTPQQGFPRKLCLPGVFKARLDGPQVQWKGRGVELSAPGVPSHSLEGGREAAVGNARVCSSLAKSGPPSFSSSSYFSPIHFARGFPGSGIGLEALRGHPWGEQPLSCWDMIPHTRSTPGSPGTQLPAFVKSKQPPGPGLCVCPGCLACGLSTRADTLSQDLGAQTGGQCPHLAPTTCSRHSWEFPKGALAALFLPQSRSTQEFPGISPKLLFSGILLGYLQGAETLCPSWLQCPGFVTPLRCSPCSQCHWPGSCDPCEGQVL